MPNKMHNFTQLVDDTAKQITGSYRDWTAFLTTAARLYKYPYHEQLMIYAQRPDATACADFNLWNRTMRRYVRRGSKGIALVDDSGDTPTLRYVFDISDTGGRDNSRRPFLWEYQPEHRNIVSFELERSFLVGGNTGIDLQLEEIAAQLADEYWNDHKQDLLDIVDGSFLEDYDEFNIGVQFRNAATVSVTYSLMSRCGMEPEGYFGHEDFLSIFDFNTPATMTFLGTAVSDANQKVLRQIEIAIKNYERGKAYEQSDIQPEWGLSDSRPDNTGGQQDLTAEQIRTDAEEISQGASGGDVQLSAAVGETDRPPDGDRPDSNPALGADDAGDDGDAERDGEPESQPPDALGGPDEQPESAGRGNNSDGADLQLTLFPAEAEQILNIDEAESIASSAFSISQADIDAELRRGSGYEGGKLRIYTVFQRSSDQKERVSFLKGEYNYYGHSHIYLDGSGGFVDYSPGKGMVFASGSYEDKVTISYTKMANRLAELIAADDYLTSEEKARYADIKRDFAGLGGVPKPQPRFAFPTPPAPEPVIEVAPTPRAMTQADIDAAIQAWKYHMNVEAIRTLRRIETEGRNATPDEQEILSRYVGWGGLPDAFDPEKPAWATEYAELKSLLSDSEYESARESTLNAHYTSPSVIKAIYEAVENMGFRTGQRDAAPNMRLRAQDARWNILEPACGVGNFFGLLPESMAHSKLYGTELDSITGRIAKLLYPGADIQVAGFETTDRRDFYDLAVGNVPFGQYKVADKPYDKLGFSIHDYFFAKTLDQVRPGGVIAFVTSRYTMDKKSPEVRRYIAERAELLGAIRLPNNAFKANAGTEVVSDIVFLQKRDTPIVAQPEWVHLGQTENGYAINSYFVEHPDMVLGVETEESTQYGRQDYTVAPTPGADLAEQLREAVSNIQGEITAIELPDLGEGEAIDNTIPADPDVKNYSYTIVNGEVYYRENSVMVRPELNATATERVKGMVELRDCVQSLINQQLDGYVSDAEIAGTQAELNRLYDDYTKKCGLINSRGNSLAFADDSSYYLLCSLEVLDENAELERKADMFTKRTIRKNQAVSSVDTASEALAVSIAEKACVDLDYMSELSGLSRERLLDDLRGVIFLNVGSAGSQSEAYVTADESDPH